LEYQVIFLRAPNWSCSVYNQNRTEAPTNQCNFHA
jgi:hypothetical protein